MTDEQALIEELRSIAEVNQSPGDRIRNTCRQAATEIEALRQPTQSDALREAVIEECAKALEADAMKCDCAALEERECGCGAWCEWKSITSARAVEIVRAVKESK